MPSDESFRRRITEEGTYLKVQDVAFFNRESPPKQHLVVIRNNPVYGEPNIVSIDIR